MAKLSETDNDGAETKDAQRVTARPKRCAANSASLVNEQATDGKAKVSE